MASVAEEDYSVFADEKIKTEGICLYELENWEQVPLESNGTQHQELNPSHVRLSKGKVFFSLHDIPLNVRYATESKILLKRIDENLAELQGSIVMISKLLELGTLKAAEKQKKLKQQEDERKQQDRVANSWEDIPSDIANEVIKCGLDPTQFKNKKNFHTLLNVIRFVKKVDLRPLNLRRDREKEQEQEAQSEMSALIRQMAHFNIVSNDNAGSFFKDSELAGKGGYGKVFFAEQVHPEKMIVAIKKQPHVNKKDREANISEIGFLFHNIHPNVVRPLKCYLCKDEAWIVTEYMSGGTMAQALEAYTFLEPEIAFVAREVLKALQFLHYKSVIHRDIKSNNIMLTCEGEVKLIDFGLCTEVSAGKKNQMCGSVYWMSPEMIQGLPYDCQVDIWSFGVVMLEMMFRNLPTRKLSKIQVMYKVATEGLTEYITKCKTANKWSDDIIDFVSQCLVVDPETRSTADQLLDHPFIKKSSNRKPMEKVITNIFLHNVLAQSGLIF